MNRITGLIVKHRVVILVTCGHMLIWYLLLGGEGPLWVLGGSLIGYGIGLAIWGRAKGAGTDAQ